MSISAKTWGNKIKSFLSELRKSQNGSMISKVQQSNYDWLMNLQYSFDIYIDRLIPI